MTPMRGAMLLIVVGDVILLAALALMDWRFAAAVLGAQLTLLGLLGVDVAR